MQAHETRSPIKRSLLFSSGVKPDLLRLCPTEEGNYVGLGSTVLITAIAASFSSTVAITVALAERWSQWPRYFPFGLAYGIAIFLIDRFLVSLQLNPHRFAHDPREGQPAFAGVGSVTRTLLGAVPRLLLAIIIAFLIAEPILLLIFRNEIDSRVGTIRTELARHKEDTVRKSYEQQLADARKPTSIDLDGDQRNDIETTETDLGAIQKDIAAVNQRIGQKVALRDEEVRKGRVTINGRTTTGIPGCGPRCRGLDKEIAIERSKLAALERRERVLSTRLEDLRQRVSGEEADRRKRLADLRSEMDREVEKARREAVNTSGLLIQIDALEELVEDDTPFGDTGKATHRGVLGLTSLGMAVWTLRISLVLLDTMPLAFKLILSLRQRRPYDEMLAEQEEIVDGFTTVRMYQLRQKLYAAMDDVDADRARAGHRFGRDALAGFAGQPGVVVRGPRGTSHIKSGQGAVIGPDVIGDLSLPDARIAIVWEEGLGWTVKPG